MKRFLSAFLVFAMMVGLFSPAALAAPDPGDFQSSSKPETVHVNSYGGTARAVDFDDHWRFNLGDAGAAQVPAFNDSMWRDVTLPHDYSIEQEYTQSGEAESGYLPGGIGWYRKSFTLSPDWQGKQLSIDFDGVYMNAKVWLNGELLGTHPYGYTAFSFPLPTRLLKFDGENVIAVKVENKIPSSRWYSGSGIYRDVKLTVTDPVHVGRFGTTVTTPNLATEYATADKNVTVSVGTAVVNSSTSAASVVLRHTVCPRGSDAPVGTVTTAATSLAAGATVTAPATLTVAAPALWSTEHPNLYTLRTEVLVDSVVTDTTTTDFGFRWTNQTVDTGFFLNGEPMKLLGVCMHHDQGALGAEAWYRATERQVEMLQEMGCNAIRVTHNPASAALIDICNQKGMLVIEEMFDGWQFSKNGNSNDYGKWFATPIEAGNTIVGGVPTTMTWAQFDTQATVARDKNSPAVIMWSLGNEIGQGSGSADLYPAQADKLIAWAKAVDATRPTTFGDDNLKNSAGWAGTISDKLTAAGGTVGFNYATDAQLDAQHAAHPTWKMYGSETASHVNSRGVYDNKQSAQQTANKRLTSYDKSAVGWGMTASNAWYTTIINDYYAGEFVWTGFDYIGEPTPWNGVGTGSQGSWPAPKSSYFGIIDTAGFPKDNYYFYQSQWNHNVNTLHMLPTWNRDEIMVDGGGKTEVVVYSDAAKVELYFTPQGGGAKQLVGTQTYHTRLSDGGRYTYQSTAESGGNANNLFMTFQVPYAPSTLEAVGYDEGGALLTGTSGRSSVTTTGPAAQLNLSADRAAIKADGKDLSYITIDVQDAKGNSVGGAEPEIALSITGNGVLVGSDSGAQADHVPYQSTTRKAFNGKLLAIVQSTKDAGEFTVTATADGHKAGSCTVSTTPIAGSSENRIVSYELSKNYYVKLGHQPVLPETLSVQYSDGSTATNAVTWNAIRPEDIQRVGSFSASGLLTGTTIAVTVNINMLDHVAALLNYSLALQPGAPYTLPQSRPAVLDDGRVLEVEFPVTWDTTGFDSSTEGTATIPGTANVFGQNLSVTATARVSRANDSTGSNVANLASELTQSIAKADQSDSLEAIRDGNTGLTRVQNPALWSDYDAAQKGKHESSITFRYDTAQNIGVAKLYFATDDRSFALPDGVAFSWSPDGSTWNPIAATVAEEPMSNGTLCTYRFDPVPAVHLRMTFTDKAGANATSLKQYSTALYEAQLFVSNSSFPISSSDALSALSFNGNAVDARVLNTRTIPTPVYFVEDVTAQSAVNAAITILPTYEKVVRILTESEDHSTRGLYQILLESTTQNTDPEDATHDYPCNKTTATAGSNQPNTGTTGEGPAAFAVDNNPNSLWHSRWSDPGDDLSSRPQDRWFRLELAEPASLDALRYQPRADATNGVVLHYRIETSMDGTTYTKVAEGTWAQTNAWKIAVFSKPVTAKYVRLWGDTTFSTTTANKWMSAREIHVRQAPTSGVSLSAASVTFDAPAFDFTGKPITPKPTVTLDGRKLTYGLDYSVSYENNTNPGTATATVTGIQNYSGTAVGSFTISAGAVTVVSYTEPVVQTMVGLAPALPQQVTGQTSAGTALSLNVTWDAIDAAQYAAKGSFVVEGSVVGQSLKPTATVSVVDVQAVQTLSAITPQGVTPTLPAQVEVYFTDGTHKPCDATWNSGDFSGTIDSIVSVIGTAALGNAKTTPIAASVRIVADALNENLALNATGLTDGKGTLPMAIANVSSPSDNPYQINDGVRTTATSGDNKKVWTDWERDVYHTDPKPWVAAILSGTKETGGTEQATTITLKPQPVSKVSIGFFEEGGNGTNKVALATGYEVQYYTGTDPLVCDTRFSETALQTGGNGFVRAWTNSPLLVDANWSTVVPTTTKPAVPADAATGNTTMVDFEFAPVNTAIVRIVLTPKANNWTGLREFEVYGVPAAHADAAASTITLDGEDKLSEFDSNKHLAVKLSKGDALPVLAATATNNAAVTVVPAAKVGGSATITIVPENGNVAAAQVYTIDFTTDTSAVTVGETTHGAVTADKAQAAQDETVLLTVRPVKGYQLKTLTAMSGATAIAVAHNRFTMPAGDVAVSAEFEPLTYTIAYELDGGSVVGTNPATYNVESPAITLLNPTKADTDFRGWTGGGLTEATAAVTLPTGSVGNRTYTAHYGQSHAVTLAPAVHGSVSATADRAESGTPVKLVVTPDKGYSVQSLEVKHTEDSTVVTVDPRGSFTMPAANVTVTAVFAPIEYTLSYTLNDGISGGANPDTYTVESPDITLLNPTKADMPFMGWSGTGLSAATKTVVIPHGSTDNRAYTALFGAPHAVTVATVENGTLSASTLLAVPGETVKITAVPAAGFRLKSGSTEIYKTGSKSTLVSGSGDGFIMPNFAVTVTAVFEAIPTENPGSSGSSGGSGSSGDQMQNEDGSITRKETTYAGTTTTTTFPDGSKTVIFVKADGSITETAHRADGTAAHSTTTAQGLTTAEVTLPKNFSGSMTLPLSPLTVSAESARAPRLTIETEKPVTLRIPVKNASASTVAVLVNADGTEQILPKSALGPDGLLVHLTGSATIKLVDNVQHFEDVTQAHWAEDAIAFASSHELFQGVSAKRFAPNETMSRAMLTTVLWRLEGKPAAGAPAGFNDLTKGAWYEDAISWATEKKIVAGNGKGFSPDDTISRAALVTMLYRYAQSGGANHAAGDLSVYGDAAQIAPWATDAMAWAVGAGILRSNDAGALAPNAAATRSEAAIILQRFVAAMQ